MTTAANETTTDVASTALSPGGDIISEQRGAIISETRGGFIGIGSEAAPPPKDSLMMWKCAPVTSAETPCVGDDNPKMPAIGSDCIQRCHHGVKQDSRDDRLMTEGYLGGVGQHRE